MQSKKDILDEVVNKLKQNENVASISLIGSGAKHYKKLDMANDLDLLILIDSGNESSREIYRQDDVFLDMSYKSIKRIEWAIEEKNGLWLGLMSQAKHIYKRDEETSNLLKRVNRAYLDGPTPLTKEDIDYIRFKLTHKVIDLENRIDSKTNFIYLAGAYVKDMAKAYFKLQNTWVPRQKRMMDTIFERDIVLYELIKASFIAEASKKHYKLIKDIMEYILKPYGGSLTTLKCQQTPMED